MSKYGKIICSTLFALIVVFVLGFVLHSKVVQAQFQNSDLSGYASSTSIGRISFNCTSIGVCGSSSYKVSVDAAGNLTGYAWANPRDTAAGVDNVGWLQFGGLSGFPTTGGSTPTNAKIVTVGTTKTLVGWARFCTPMYPSMTCASTPSNAGGWDGWVSFDGSGRNVRVSSTPISQGSTIFALQGYAWSANLVDINGNGGADMNNELIGPGWIDMSQVRLVQTPTAAPNLYISASPNPTSSGDTNLTYYTDPGSSFQTCAGGLAVDNVTGASQSVAGWTGPLLTIGGTVITRTVSNVNVPYDETVFAVSCYHAATTTTVTKTILVEKLPLAAVPKIDLCLVDPTTGLNASGCGAGTVNVTQNYASTTTHAQLIWKSVTPGVTYTSCAGIGGMASDWDRVNQTPVPGTSYSPVRSRLMHPIQATTVYQLKCTDADTGLPVVSNTATAFRVPDVLDPEVDLKVDIAGDSIPSFSDGPLIFSTTTGGNVDLMWETQDITSPYCQVTSTQTFIDPGTGAVSTIQGAWPLHNVSSATFSTESVSISSTTTFRIDCPDPTGVSRSVSDTATVRVPGIPDPAQPAGPKKPKFIEI